MKALVTGGSGFIGSYISQELVKQNISTIVYDNLSTGSLENLGATLSDMQIIEANILDLDRLQSAMKGQIDSSLGCYRTYLTLRSRIRSVGLKL